MGKRTISKNLWIVVNNWLYINILCYDCISIRILKKVVDTYDVGFIRENRHTKSMLWLNQSEMIDFFSFKKGVDDIMIKIIKQEIKISYELKNKVEWACKLNSTKLLFIKISSNYNFKCVLIILCILIFEPFY